MPEKHKLIVGLVTDVGTVVVAEFVNSHKVPLKPDGQEQVERMVQVPPLRQGVVKQDWNAPTLNSHKLPPNPLGQVQVLTV